MTADPRPLICILDGAIDRTGGLTAARREAELLRDLARFMLVLPEDSSVADSDLPEFERVLRLPIVHPRRSWRAASAYLPSLVKSGYRLAELLHEARCSRLQVNDFYLMQGAAARLFGFDGCIATWIRIDPRRYGWIGKFWLDRAAASSDHLVAVSRFILGTLPTDLAATTIYDPAIAAPAGDGRTNSQRFVFIGNYIEGKGQDLGIAAFHRIAAEFPNAELIFHGSDMGLAKNGQYRDRLVELAGSGPGRARIQLEGYSSDLAPVYASALAALNCSVSESFSLTCLEASSRGLPVIATRSGGPQEIIEDGVTGILVPVGDAEAVADAMRNLLNDPRNAADMGRAGAGLVRDRFSADRFREQLAELFGLQQPE